MQISSVSTTQLLPVGNSSAASPLLSHDDYVANYGSSLDGAVLNHSADSFASYVAEAKAMPEVRGEVVDFYKSQIRSGHYPSEDIVAGLTHLLGGAIAGSLKSHSS